MSIWLSYGPVTGEPDLAIGDGREIDVAYTTMQESAVIRLTLDYRVHDLYDMDLTRDEVRELIKRLAWALERTQ